MANLHAFTMPKWGIEMVEGIVSEWNIHEGERVTKGQVVVQVETDKIVNEIQAERAGVFVRLIAVPGETYRVGALLAITADEVATSEEVDEFIQTALGNSGHPVPSTVVSHAMPALPPLSGDALCEADVAASRAARQLASRLHVDLNEVKGSGRAGRISFQDVDQASKPACVVGGVPVTIMVSTHALDGHFASPMAKRLAREHAVDLNLVQGTGRAGRISRRDVARAAGISAASARGQVDVVRMSPARKAIARQLTLSKSTIPHFYLRSSLNLEPLTALRLEAKRHGGPIPSFNDYFVRAAALALLQNPDVNIQVLGEEIHRFHDADVALAVATERGLITPIVRAAQTKSVEMLSVEMKTLIARARTGKLKSHEIDGGSFTVSNLGMFNVEQFDAIINPPQGAILAIGASRRRPVESHGLLALAATVQVSMSCDHRAIDGAVGAKFLDSFCKLVECPLDL